MHFNQKSMKASEDIAQMYTCTYMNAFNTSVRRETAEVGSV